MSILFNGHRIFVLQLYNCPTMNVDTFDFVGYNYNR